MKHRVVVTPTAERHFDALDAWWKKNRDKNPFLFVDEFAEAVSLLKSAPEGGFAVQTRVGEHFRRVLLQGCGYHLYYWHQPGNATVWIIGIWGAQRKRR